MTIYIARFIGYCNIAISEDKTMIKEYLKNVRKLSKEDYKIFSKDISSESEEIDYSDRPEYITTKYGLLYTNLDWYIINKDFDSYVTDLYTTRDTIEETILNMSKILSNRGEDSLQESLEEINDILRKINVPGEQRDEVARQFCKNHELNYMHIIPYLSYTQVYERKYAERMNDIYFPRF